MAPVMEIGNHAYQYRSPAVGMDHEETHGVAATAAEAMIVGSVGGTEQAGWRSSHSFAGSADARLAESVEACKQGWAVLVGYRIVVVAGTVAELVARFPWRRMGVLALVDTPLAGVDHDPERVSSPVLVRIDILEAVARTQLGSAIDLGCDPSAEIGRAHV